MGRMRKAAEAKIAAATLMATQAANDPLEQFCVSNPVGAAGGT